MGSLRYSSIVVSAVAVLGFASAAQAQTVIEDIITIPIDSVLRAPAGSVTPVASAPVPAQFQGSACLVEVEADNQESVHENNDLIISSGGSSGEVDDFESEAFGVRGASLPLVLGDTVSVSLRMGPDGISSGGVLITIDCTQQPVESTVPPTTEAEVAPPESTTTIVEVAPPGSETTTTEVQSFPPAQAPAPTTTVATTSNLPATGADDTAWLAVAALLLLAGGGALVTVARAPRESSH